MACWAAPRRRRLARDARPRLQPVSADHAQGDTPAPAAPPATPVSVAVVEQRDVVVWDEFSGRLEAIERVEIRSRVAGAVQAVHFREGALVKQGDLLITIDPAPYRGRGRARRRRRSRRPRRALRCAAERA